MERKTLDLRRSVYELTEQEPALKEVLAGLGFDCVLQPGLRAPLPPAVTSPPPPHNTTPPDASSVGGCVLEMLVSASADDLAVIDEAFTFGPEVTHFEFVIKNDHISVIANQQATLVFEA